MTKFRSLFQYYGKLYNNLTSVIIMREKTILNNNCSKSGRNGLPYFFPHFCLQVMFYSYFLSSKTNGKLLTSLCGSTCGLTVTPAGRNRAVQLQQLNSQMFDYSRPFFSSIICEQKISTKLCKNISGQYLQN